MFYHPELARLLEAPVALGAQEVSQAERLLAQPVLYNMRSAMGHIHGDNLGSGPSSPIFHVSFRARFEKLNHNPTSNRS